MSQKTKNMLTLFIILASAAVSLIGILVLPSTLTVQLSAEGAASGTLPSYLAMLIPFALCTVFALVWRREESTHKGLIGLIAGAVVYICCFAFNL